MTKVNNDVRANFFPNSKTNESKATNEAQISTLKRNDPERLKELEGTQKDARVTIPEGIRDFSRIKKAVDAAPEIDNSEKIAKLREQINDGNYTIDYEALADRLLEQEF